VRKITLLDDNSLLTCVSYATIEGRDDPNVVKAVLNKMDEALYFSRAPIPFDRDGGGKTMFVHWGVYGFTARSLARFCGFPQGELEKGKSSSSFARSKTGCASCVSQPGSGAAASTRHRTPKRSGNRWKGSWSHVKRN